MAESVGFLEVYGLTAAFVAADGPQASIGPFMEMDQRFSPFGLSNQSW